MRCPTTEQLAAYHAGFVTAREQQYLDAHVAACPHCRQEMAALTKTVDWLARVPAPKVPRDLWPGVAQRIQGHTQQRWGRAWWRLAATAGMLAGGLLGVFLYHGQQQGHLPAAPAMAASYVTDHQFLTAQDSLTDRASLGVALASYRSEGE